MRRQSALLVFDGNFTSQQIHAKSEGQCETLPVKAIFVDYLQLIVPANQKTNREEQVADSSRRLKQLAMQMRVPVFAAAQLNREAKGQPSLSHLRESGAIEQNANIVMLLDNRHTLAPKEEFFVLVAKHRSGSEGQVTLTWERPLCRIRDRTVEEAGYKEF